MKANRLNSKVTAGPQSNILEGYTWDEIRQMQVRDDIDTLPFPNNNTTTCSRFRFTKDY